MKRNISRGAMRRLFFAAFDDFCADEGANIFEVVHHRIGSSHSVNVVDLSLTLEVRDRAHGEAVLGALRAADYRAEVVEPFR